MKINEKGSLVASDEEMSIVKGMVKAAVDEFVEKSGITKAQVPGAVAQASANAQKSETESFEAKPGENMHEKTLRLQKASVAISGGNLAVENAPKELKTFRFFDALAKGNTEVVQAISGQAQNTLKALGITTDGDGAPLIPVEFDTDLKVAIEDYSLSALCTNYDMKSNELDLRTVTAKPIVYQVNEGVAATQGAPKFDAPKLVAKAFAGLQTMSKEFFEDNNVGAYQQLVALYAEALGKRRDHEILVGTTFTGVLKAAGVQPVTLDGASINDIVYKKIVRLTNMLTDAQKSNGAAFAMHRLIFSVIAEMVDANGKPIVLNPWDAKSRVLLGNPVKLTEAAPYEDAADTSYIAYGNFKWVAFGRRMGTTAQILKEGTVANVNLAEQRSLGLMIDERWGVMVGKPDYLSKIVTAK